jgi:hypothetical protein
LKAIDHSADHGRRDGGCFSSTRRRSCDATPIDKQRPRLLAVALLQDPTQNLGTGNDAGHPPVSSEVLRRKFSARRFAVAVIAPMVEARSHQQRTKKRSGLSISKRWSEAMFGNLGPKNDPDFRGNRI